MTDGGPGTVLVTGAARRIGRAIAEDLARSGRPIGVHYAASKAEAKEAVAAIRADGGNAKAFAADLADVDAAAGLVARVARDLGPVTGLINNASLFEPDDPDTLTVDSWDSHLSVNLRAPMLLSQAFARDLPADAEGAIINMVDQRVWNLSGGFTSYTISKYALWGLTQTLARALAPRIRVNAIGPGPTIASSRQSADDFAEQWRSTPLGKPVDPLEICRTVRFILDAEAMTGQMIALDSGQHFGLGFVDDAE